MRQPEPRHRIQTTDIDSGGFDGLLCRKRKVGSLSESHFAIMSARSTMAPEFLARVPFRNGLVRVYISYQSISIQVIGSMCLVSCFEKPRTRSEACFFSACVAAPIAGVQHVAGHGWQELVFQSESMEPSSDAITPCEPAKKCASRS